MFVSSMPPVTLDDQTLNSVSVRSCDATVMFGDHGPVVTINKLVVCLVIAVLKAV